MAKEHLEEMEQLGDWRARRLSHSADLEELAEPEGFEPSIRLFNRITV